MDQVDELKTSPVTGELTKAPELAARALDRELNAKPPTADVNKAVVNDLTTMVKKKKRPAEVNGSGDPTGKRKADDEAVSESKKAKVEDTGA